MSMTTLNDDMPSGDEPSLNLIAAQYVLGTLSPSARLRFQARLQQEPALRTLTHAWERRLNPLTHLLEPQPVPAHVWAKIEAQLDQLPASQTFNSSPVLPVMAEARSASSLPPPMSNKPVKATNDHFWRPWAWASSAIAAGLALFVVVHPYTTSAPQQVAAQQAVPVGHDVAVLSTDKNSPAWVVRQQGNSLVLSALNAQAIPSDRDLELWSIKGKTAPRSLGVLHIHDGQAIISRVTADLVVQDVTLAVSLEPKNGSKTGQPTGVVLYTGKIVRT